MKHIIFIVALLTSLFAKPLDVRFIVRDTTVIDNATKLMWQKETGKKNISWKEAKEYCENLSKEGHYDWRLPHIDELMSIVDKNAYGPSIDTNFFPNTINDYYWSSTPQKADNESVWLVFFNYGYGHYYYRDDNKGCVRCVRSLKD